MSNKYEPPSFLFKMLIQNIYFCHPAGWHRWWSNCKCFVCFLDHQKLFTVSIYFFSPLNFTVCERLGTKRFKVAYLSDTVLILCVFNVDEQSLETPCAVILAGMYDPLIVPSTLWGNVSTVSTLSMKEGRGNSIPSAVYRT